MKSIAGKSYIRLTNVLVQRISLQLFNTYRQINFAVQMNACTG